MKKLIFLLFCNLILSGCNKQEPSEKIEITIEGIDHIVSHESLFSTVIPITINPEVDLTTEEVTIRLQKVNAEGSDHSAVVKGVTTDPTRKNGWNILVDFKFNLGIYKAQVCIKKTNYGTSWSEAIPVEMKEWPSVKIEYYQVTDETIMIDLKDAIDQLSQKGFQISNSFSRFYLFNKEGKVVENRFFSINDHLFAGYIIVSPPRASEKLEYLGEFKIVIELNHWSYNGPEDKAYIYIPIFLHGVN